MKNGNVIKNILDKSRIKVDFNEMIDEDILLLSKTESKVTSSGMLIDFIEGKVVYVYEEDYDENSELDYLIAEDLCEINKTGNFLHVKWCLKIDKNGIRHFSDLKEGSQK